MSARVHRNEDAMPNGASEGMWIFPRAIPQVRCRKLSATRILRRRWLKNSYREETWCKSDYWLDSAGNYPHLWRVGHMH